VRRLNAKAESNRDKNAMLKVKVKCVMWNKQIDGLAINHSPTPLLEKKRIRVVNAKEMESSSKINLKDVL
jgi:hypothetical protein